MPGFIKLDGALAIHREQITIFGGTHGLRDQTLLESALDQAEQTFRYTDDLFEQRLSIASPSQEIIPSRRQQARGGRLHARLSVTQQDRAAMTSAELFEWTMQVAIGKLSRADLAELLRQHSRRKN